MHKAVQVPCALLDHLPQLVLAVHVKHIGNDIQGIVVVLHFRLQARKVKPIVQIVLVDLAKVLVPARRDELFCPRGKYND